MSEDGFFILPDLDDDKIIIPDATDISNKPAKNNTQIPKSKQFSSEDCSPETKQKKPSNDRRTFFRLRAVVIFAVLLLIGYYSVHFWTDGSCTEDSFCTLCGKIRTTAPGHQWNKATCTNAKYCEECGETEGTPLAHNWKAATCTELKTCRDCGKTEGTVLAHDWQDATCTQPATCVRCGQTTGTNSHTWTNNSTDVLKKCSLCLKQVEFFYSPQAGELLAWTEYEMVNNQKTNPVSYSARDEKRIDWEALTEGDDFQGASGDGVHLFYVKGKIYYFDRGNHKIDRDIAYNLAVAGSRYTKVTQYLWEEDDELLSVQLAVDYINDLMSYPIPDIIGAAYAAFDVNGVQHVIVRILDSDEVYAVRSNWKK